jgi:hypothetical protein
VTKLQKFYFCPICGGSNRVLDQSGMAFYKPDAGYHYIKHAANFLNVSVQQFISDIHVYRCLTCDTLYCDPWLSSEHASSIFTTGASDHIAGWGTFENWLSSGYSSRGQLIIRKLHSFLIHKIGHIATYAELGCPFQGLLLLYKGEEMQPPHRISLFKRAIYKTKDERWSRVTRLHYFLSNIANICAIYYLKIRLTKENFLRTKNDIKILALPAIRFLITEDTCFGWGNNCVRYNGSCRYYAAKVLDVNVLPLAEAVERVSSNTTSLFDLLGIFNSLDHMNFPILTIKNGLKIAKNIIVVTHHATHAGKQHRFAFGEKFPDWLRSNLGDVNVEDVTTSVLGSRPRNENYIFISKR